MRGLKIKTTPVLTGYQIYHNYIREHQGIGNLTPAEKCGIKVEGENQCVRTQRKKSFRKLFSFSFHSLSLLIAYSLHSILSSGVASLSNSLSYSRYLIRG